MEDIVCKEYDPIFDVVCNSKHNMPTDSTHIFNDGAGTAYRWRVGGPEVQQVWTPPEGSSIYMNPAAIAAWAQSMTQAHPELLDGLAEV